MKIVTKVFTISLAASMIVLISCNSYKKTGASQEREAISVNINGQGTKLNISLETGNSHNHPTFAIWAEKLDGSFIQTLFVTKSIGTGIYGHGPLEAEKWDNKPGWQSRPAALPYWLNKRLPLDGGQQLPDPEHPVADAYTGATPKSSALISSRLDQDGGSMIRIMFEVNQPWDWNDYWTNDLYDNADYRTSCQPSLVYAVTIDLNQTGKVYHLNPIGHGHYSGANGELFTDISTITTARDIFSVIKVEVVD